MILGVLPIVSLAIQLVVVGLVGSSVENQQLLQKAILHERKGLAYDETMFRKIRTEMIVEEFACMVRRSRRNAYKLIRELETRRRKFIEMFLDRNHKQTKIEHFFEDLRRIHTDHLYEIQPIGVEMKKACAYPDDVKDRQSKAIDMLTKFLQRRRPELLLEDNLKNLSEMFTPVGSFIETDFWDEQEVDSDSDKGDAEAVARAKEDEKSALEEDKRQIDEMACHFGPHFVAIIKFRDSRQRQIEQLLDKSFSSPKQLRRELFTVYTNQLAEVDRLNEKLVGDGISPPYELMHWLDVYFHERQLASIKGRSWTRYILGELPMSHDFYHLRMNRLIPGGADKKPGN